MFSSFGFGGSMWNSGPQTSLSILMLLKKKDLCLDELLNDDDILTELKTSNKDLVSFLTKQDTFKQLIDLILVEKNIAEDEPDYKRYCKIPYVACEALTADCPAVITTFVDCCQDSENEKVPIEDKEYKFLAQLFGFLDRKEFNYTSAGYFAKIGTLILEKKPADIIAYLYKKHPESLDKMLNHISSESIADLLIKLMTFESSAITDVTNDVYENKIVQILKLLSQKLETETEQEILKNTAYVISGVFGKSQLMHKGHDILAHMLDSASVEGFFKILKTKNAASISAAVTVLESMFDYYVRLNTPINPINEENKLPEEIDMTPKISSDVPLAAITIEHMNSIVDSIADATDAAAPFGNHRLRLIDFINTALKTHSTEINTAIAKSDFFKVILEMCVRFEWNSILHNQVEKIITITVDTIFDDIKASLFGNGNILSIIVDSFEDSKIRVPIGKRGKTVRKGHLGQFIKIANKIIECTDPIIVGYIEKDQTWKEFVATKMIAINEIRTMKLGEGAGLETAKNAVRKPMVFDMQDEKPVSAAKPQPEHNEQQIDQQDSATASSGNKRTLISKRNKTEKNLFHPKRDKYESIFKTRALKNQKKEEPEEEEEQEEPKKSEEPKKVEKVEEPKKIEAPEQKPAPTVTIDLKQAKDEPEVMNKTPTTQNGNKVPGFTSFYSIFNFSPKGLTSIHALLQKPDTTINHLLNDENLIKEVKSGNGEVLKFLIKKENFRKLIDHIIVEPSAPEQECNFKQCCKLPFVCSEVLSTGSSTIASTLVSYSTPDKERTSIENREYRYLNQLFSFLDQAEQNYTAAGYFAKVVSNLAEKKPFDFLTFLYKRRPEILDNLAKHISLESIADLLLKLLTIESSVIVEIPDCPYQTKVIQILKLLSEKLKTPNSQDVTKNAAYVISEVIYKSKGLHKGSEIVDSLLDSASIENLFKILKTKDTGSVSATAVVLGNIFNYYIQLNTPKELNCEQPIVKATIKHMESIVQLIGDVDKVASLGSFRLKLIDFMGIAIDINNNEVNIEIAKCSFFSALMKLFLKFEWHNILHAQIEEIIASVLESNSVNLKISLFEDAKILEIILDVLDEKKTLVPAGKRGKKIRRGYLGHLIRIANKVAECQDADVKKYTESNDAWQDFVRTKLATINEIDNADLGEDKK